MPSRTQRSLRDEWLVSAVAATAFVVASAIVLHAYLPPPTRRLHPRSQASAVADLLATAAKALVRGDDPPQVDTWAQQVARSDMVLGLVIIGADGKIEALAADRGNLAQPLVGLAERVDPGKPVRRVAIPEISTGGPSVRAWLAIAPLGAGRAPAGGYLAVLVDVGSDQPPAWWLFPVAMAGIATVIAGATAWRMLRCVSGPIATLTRACAKSDFAAIPPQLTRRPDLMGRLARCVQSIGQKLVECEARAEDLAQTLDRRVAARTRQVSLALRRAERHAWEDPLTGVVSRRFIDNRLPEIFEAQRQAGQDLTLVMLDLDDFKRFNDTFGHQAGDELLRFVGNLVRHTIRETDIAARYGGDEFLLILPAASLEQGVQIAGRIAALFAQQARILPAPGHPMAVSAGLASLEVHKPSDLSQLIRLADDALYDAKRTGRQSLTAPVEVGTAG